MRGNLLGAHYWRPKRMFDQLAFNELNYGY